MEPPVATAATAAGATLAEKMPVEIEENILILMPVPDLLVAAAHLPLSWRTILEDSKRLRDRVINFFKRPEFSTAPVSLPPGPLTADIAALFDSYTHSTFKCDLYRGRLLAHRRENGDEGFLFVPCVPHLSMTILDPATKKMRWLHFRNARRDHGTIELHDLDGLLVCENGRAGEQGWDCGPLQSYIRAFGHHVQAWISESQRKVVSPGECLSVQRRSWCVRERAV